MEDEDDFEDFLEIFVENNKCSLCGLKFANLASYQKHCKSKSHLERVSGSTSKKVNCPCCNVSMRSNSLRFHLPKCQKKNIEQVVEIVDDNNFSSFLGKYKQLKNLNQPLQQIQTLLRTESNFSNAKEYFMLQQSKFNAEKLRLISDTNKSQYSYKESEVTTNFFREVKSNMDKDQISNICSRLQAFKALKDFETNTEVQKNIKEITELNVCLDMPHQLFRSSSDGEDSSTEVTFQAQDQNQKIEFRIGFFISRLIMWCVKIIKIILKWIFYTHLDFTLIIIFFAIFFKLYPIVRKYFD